MPITHRGNNGLYAVIDQQLYRPKGGDSQSGISVFSRMSISPSDRNLISAYIDGGIVFAGLIPNRPDDRFGASVIYAKFSDSVRAFDIDTVLLTGVSGPIRDYETNLELTYMAQIVPGWTVQPNLQFIWHPNGDATKNATVVGRPFALAILGPRYCSLMLAARIALAHLSVSAAMNVPNSAGDSASTVPPRSVIRACNFGSAKPALISLLSLSTISAGVSFGAPTPYHALTS